MLSNVPGHFIPKSKVATKREQLQTTEWVEQKTPLLFA
jgi:hypothetical protein